MKDKKGNINLIVPSILVLTLAAILLVFGLLILDEVKEETAGIESHSVTAEVVTQAELTASTAIANAGACQFGGLSVSSCSNGSAAGIVIASGNYSVGSNYINNLTNTFSTASWYCNYTYTDGGEACRAANETIVGMGKFADYYDLIVLAIVITIIISLLLVVFSLRKQQ